ncbi:D-serine ammonia-lyase [Bacillus massiliglaciei]|uniref:D-serine ammonia-lyase n=1 Tax=Bacillus massiliglaciei TaxID=1816693 RepID=UPI000AA4B591|nr:D-serine ammonia-lyase [Bacillus massiliglaciei]
MKQEISEQISDLVKDSMPFAELVRMEETFWRNPSYEPNLRETSEKVKEAEARWRRFVPYLKKVYPETKERDGRIDSPLMDIPKYKKFLQGERMEEMGSLFLKCDHLLAISGSIKARGGIYEVLKHAESLALKNGLISENDDYSIFASDESKSFFSQYSIAVGSTGNLGLSIGMIGKELGFDVTVHMSKEAMEWKKEKLRSIGANVKEYEQDYGIAVESGRSQALLDPMCHFIDDEQSFDLFYGYAAAAGYLKEQLQQKGIIVDEEHPLFVYLPCGVGGGPGGITFGLKLLFGKNVHCFFAEPTHSPCMLLGLMTGLKEKISVQDIGLDNKTMADGLAVGRPSKLVSEYMERHLSGCYTIKDERLFKLLQALFYYENHKVEPSSAAAAFGPAVLLNSEEGQKYLEENQLSTKLNNAAHIIWSTGGSMVPDSIMNEYLIK